MHSSYWSRQIRTSCTQVHWGWNYYKFEWGLFSIHKGCALNDGGYVDVDSPNWLKDWCACPRVSRFGKPRQELSEYNKRSYWNCQVKKWDGFLERWDGPRICTTRLMYSLPKPLPCLKHRKELSRNTSCQEHVRDSELGHIFFWWFCTKESKVEKCVW